MVNYLNGKIYKLVCNVTGKIYVGSTCEPLLSRRMAGHKGGYKSYLKGKRPFISSYLIIENNNYDIVLIENVSCNSKDELHKKERGYIESIECVNFNMSHNTEEERKKYIAQYRLDNNELLKEHSKRYYHDHKQYYRDRYLRNKLKSKINL